MKRITADWDFKNKFKCLFFINRIFNLKFKEIIIKPSKRGFHIVVWHNQKGKQFDLRKYIGDDRKRIYMDKTHRYARNTLFSKKKKYLKWKKKWM